jgi:hypothetical protein
MTVGLVLAPEMEFARIRAGCSRLSAWHLCITRRNNEKSRLLIYSKATNWPLDENGLACEIESLTISTQIMDLFLVAIA